MAVSQTPEYAIAVNNTGDDFGFCIKWAQTQESMTPGTLPNPTWVPPQRGQTSPRTVPAGQSAQIGIMIPGNAGIPDGAPMTCWIMVVQPRSHWDGHESADNFDVEIGEPNGIDVHNISYDWNEDDFSHSAYFFSRQS